MPAHRAHTTVQLSQDAGLYGTCLWYLQNMIVMEPRNVLLSHCASISFYTLYDLHIAFKCSIQ